MRDKKARHPQYGMVQKAYRGPSLRAQVEYAVIPTELDETADVHGDDLSDTAQQCRFRLAPRAMQKLSKASLRATPSVCQGQQAFLVFGARGRNSEGQAKAVRFTLHSKALCCNFCSRRHRSLVSNPFCIGTWISRGRCANNFGSCCPLVHQRGQVVALSCVKAELRIRHAP